MEYQSYFNENSFSFTWCRSQESIHTQEQDVNQWEKETRIVKTSEDQYIRPDSSSSKSSADEERISPKPNPQNPPSTHQLKPDFNRVLN